MLSVIQETYKATKNINNNQKNSCIVRYVIIDNNGIWIK